MKPFDESKLATPENAKEQRQTIKRKIYRALEHDDLDLAENLLRELRRLLEAPVAPAAEPTEEEMEAERQEALALLEQIAKKAQPIEYHYAALKINVPDRGKDPYGAN